MNGKILLFVCFLTSVVLAQPMAEPLKSKYRQAKTSQQKGEILMDTYRASSADSIMVAKTIALQEWFRKNHDELGERYTGLYIANVFLFKGDGNIALKIALPILQKFEQDNDEYGMMRSNHIIGMAYSASKSYDASFPYLDKAIEIGERRNDKKFLSIAYNGNGVVYGEAGKPEQGVVYAQKAMQLDTEANDIKRLPVSLSTVGENYIALKSYDIAMPFLKRSFSYINKNERNTYSDVYINYDLSEAFLGLGELDSAMHYANRAIKKSLALDIKIERLRSYHVLIAIFEKINRQDSLNKYYKLAIKTKDDLYGVEKLRSVQNMNYAEQLRQLDIEAEKAKTEEERRQNIQYAIIATGIITFFIVFLMLSRTIIVNEKWISFLAILALLLVFEFINLLIHPFLERITHHSPILMLLCLVALASLLIPLHHKLEHFIKHRLTEKNKAIRLAAAKKTILELDQD